ncbi:UDP-N-acetylglucosamine--N-acetylmuramyl-(pentapeptide) pyrophosphoryl-undecaprenol N-acetylglucosamine transferase [Patescibacteria group bacterium]|nr:UDP-N-acetylglucosamine--N-acetylmuramyl-(pentapeptide) pyrophosphoryl-undecaprenol N-acetylglucosamine transferase [Patescibacteria group bacterium]
MKILITGAHFTPAIATIEELKKFDDVSIVYAGRKTTLEGDKASSPESQTLPLLGVKFIPIITGRLQRAFTIYTIPSLLKIPIGLFQALYIILSEKPDVILSFGGYVAVPVVIMGWLLSVPIIIHEQTLVSGLANKISSWFADKIAVSFEENACDNTKVILTGNPIRSEIIEISEEISSQKRKAFNILIMGGNQGSHVINMAVERALDKLLKITSVIHVTGDNKFKDFEKLKKSQNDRYKVMKWIGSGYGGILQKTDLVVCRAGINTLMELTFLGKPALVIPIAFQKEQGANAGYFKKLGLVKILPQQKLSAENLIKNIKSMLVNLDDLTLKAKEGKRAIIPDGAKRLALETVLMKICA